MFGEVPLRDQFSPTEFRTSLNPYLNLLLPECSSLKAWSLERVNMTRIGGALGNLYGMELGSVTLKNKQPTHTMKPVSETETISVQ